MVTTPTPPTLARDSSPRPDPAARDAVASGFGAHDGPERIGKYRIVGQLGEGGMSVVYRGRDDTLDRFVAIKLLHRHLARDPEARARLSREARACARLTHPHIPEIHDFSGADGTDDGRAFIVSELVDGPSLAELLRHSPPRLPEVGVMLVMGIAEALDHAHRGGVVHRDVKPENVLVGRDGVVKLTDFGIAHVIGLESVTMTGTLIGSPQHMAPEQIDGTRDLDHRVDIWGFGTVLFMVLSGGQPPFEGSNPHNLLRKIVAGEREDVRRSNPHVDAELAAIVNRCMALKREARFATMRDVHTALEAWLVPRDLGPAQQELKGFLQDPAGYERLLEQRLVEPLFQAALTLEARRNTHGALELLGRTLLLSPDHAPAAARLRRIERRLARRRGAVWAAGIAATLLAASTGAWALWPSTVESVGVARLFDNGPGTTIAARAADDRPDVSGSPPDTSGEASTEAVAAAFVDGTRPGPDAATEIDDVGATAEPKPEIVEGDEPSDVAAPDASMVAGTPIRDSARTQPRIPTANTISAQFTVFPPAIKMKLDGKPVGAGKAISIETGRHTVLLSHPGCPECGEDVQTFTIPDDQAGEFRRHFVFERQPGAYEPVTLLVTCESGGWAQSRDGERFSCNQEHKLPVTSPRPALLELTVFSREGVKLESRRFTIRPNAPILWRL